MKEFDKSIIEMIMVMIRLKKVNNIMVSFHGIKGNETLGLAVDVNKFDCTYDREKNLIDFENSLDGQLNGYFEVEQISMEFEKVYKGGNEHSKNNEFVRVFIDGDRIGIMAEFWREEIEDVVCDDRR